MVFIRRSCCMCWHFRLFYPDEDPVRCFDPYHFQRDLRRRCSTPPQRSLPIYLPPITIPWPGAANGYRGGSGARLRVFFSVVVGAVILWQPTRSTQIFRFFLDKLWMLAITPGDCSPDRCLRGQGAVVDRKSLCPLGWKSKKEVTRCRNRQNRKARLSPL